MPSPPQPAAAAVDLVEVREVLQRYVRALSGEAVLLLEDPEAAGARASCLMGMLEEAGEALVRLPPREPFAAYKRAAAHHAGHLEAGTRRFDAARASGFSQDLRALVPGGVSGGGGASGLAGFLGAFPDAQLAWRLFDLMEDARVDAFLRTRYRGLRRLFVPPGGGPDLTRLPLRHMVFAALARLAAGQALLLALPETAAVTALRAAGLVNLMATPGRSVEDAAEAAARAYLLLKALPNPSAAVWQRLEPVVVDLPRAVYGPAADAEDWRRLWHAVHAGAPDTILAWDADGDRARAETDEDEAGSAGEAAGAPVPVRRRSDGDRRALPAPGEGSGAEAAAGREPVALDGSPAAAQATRERVFMGVAGASPAAVDPVPGGAMDRLLCEGKPVPFTYPEWDHRAGRYRPGWCTVWERRLKAADSSFFESALRDHRYLVRQVERRFEMLRPDLLRLERGLEDGEDFDLDRVIDARVERRAAGHLHQRVYQRRSRLQRSVSLLVLLDMSLSTSEGVLKLDPRKDDLGWTAFERPAYKRIVDVEKESLVVLSRALEQVGDRYGIYGFSGRGRQGTRFYVVKGMGEPLAGAVGRIGTIAPVQATRMGPAVRHATAILRREPSRTKILVIIGDGQPQDVDYGTGEDPVAHARLTPSEQRQIERAYALADTHKALTEARTAGIAPFLLSIDRHGQDYLRAICGGFGYAVVPEVGALPRRLVALYDLLAT